MSQYDGSIRINTEIDAKNVNSQMMRVVNSIRKAEAEVSRLRARMEELENTNIPTEEYKNLQKELAAAEKEMGKMLAQDSKFAEINEKIRKLAQYASEYEAKLEDLGAKSIPTQEYKNATKEVEKLEHSLENAYTKKERFLETGGDESSRTFKNMQYDIEALEIKLRQAKQDVKNIMDSGQAFTLGKDTEEYQKLTDKYSEISKELEKQKSLHGEIAQKQAESVQKTIELKSAISQMEKTGTAFTSGVDTEEYARAAEKVSELNGNIEVSKLRLSELRAKQNPITKEFGRIKTSAKKAFDTISNGAQKSNISLSGGLKTILKYGFGIRSLYVLINKIRGGIKESFSNLMNYSTDFASSVQGLKNSLSTLGNQFAAAFAPIVQMVIPWLTSLINAISTAMTYVSQFIAILGGKSTFTRAKQVQDGYNKSLGGTASAAKKAYGALAKFDDLDVLQKKDDESGGGGEAVGDMFEEVPIDSKFNDWLDGILEKLKKLKDIFMEGFGDGLGDWEYRWEIIKDAIASIKESLIDIFTDPAVLAAADAWVQSVAYMLGSLSGSMASIGLTIAANLLGGIAKYLEQNKDRIKEYFVSMFDVWEEINYLLADFFQSFAYVFEAFASEQGQQLTANIIGIFADPFMGATELASKTIRDILNIIIKPFTENKEGFRTALEGFLSVLSDVTGTIKKGIDDTFDKFNDIYDEHLKPFFDSVADGLSKIIGKFLEFWNGNVQPILEQMAADFDALWEAHIQPLLNNAADFLGKVADLLKALWENIIVPFVEWIIQNVLPKLLPIVEIMWANIKGFIGLVADAINSIITVFSGVIDFLAGVFSGDWELAFLGLQEIAQGFSDFLTGIWEAIYETAMEIWEIIKQYFGDTWNNIKETATEIWEKVRFMFEEKMNAMKEKVSDIIDKFKEFKGNTSEIFNKIKETISETIGNAIGKLSDFIGKIRDAIQAVKDFLASGFEKISGFFGGLSGGFSSGGRSVAPAGYSASAMSYSMPKIPALASGSVIRGGNPFMAILGDQPRGQTNIEAPLSTIRQALREEMSDFSFGGGQLKVVLQVNGSDLAQATLNDFLSEMNRQGLDVEVLGVT